jgi:phosphoribosyl 1,2-cyclic phosphodiesterase
MIVTLWGTRGSIAAPGPDTARYGGNTACVEVLGQDGTVLVLDAGTGVRRLGAALPPDLPRVDVLLSHLHLDHIQGLGFFAPLYDPDMEVHIWGPTSTTLGLRERLRRYLSPPLFPIPMRDLPCRLTLHELPDGEVRIGGFEVSSALVCHPGPTVGYRIGENGVTLTYLSDHEPALGAPPQPLEPGWISGYALAAGADLLIHDAQYSDAEYAERVGWGHSSVRQCFEYAARVGVRRLVPFHHDPDHCDAQIDDLIAAATAELSPEFTVEAGREGAVFEVGAATSR